MSPFPLVLADIFGHWGAYVVFLFIGIAFGAVLEMSGFGYSPKLAAQFYFKDMTVLKVMFTAIVVAMVLIFWMTTLGVLDYNLIWVNPTYLWPGILGGLVMGVGFIVGGFCPGTSLVSAATGKIDGIMFVLGVFFGIFMFGETVGSYEAFWNSSNMGRFTMQEFLGIDVGVLILIIVVGAVLLFFASEKLEAYFGGKDISKEPRWRYGAAGVLVMGAFGLVLIGQPSLEDRWDRVSEDREALLADYAVQIHPGELLELNYDNKIVVKMIDVRTESDYNIFHIEEAEHIPVDELTDYTAEFHLEPANTVFVVMSNDEQLATEAWKIMQAESIPNAYILGGGINTWISTFAEDEFIDEHPLVAHEEDQLGYTFLTAIGSRHPVSSPNHDVFDEGLEYTKKVELETKRAPTAGGCG